MMYLKNTVLSLMQLEFETLQSENIFAVCMFKVCLFCYLLILTVEFMKWFE